MCSDDACVWVCWLYDLGLKTLVQGISSPVPEGHSCSWCGLITTSCVDEVSS